MREEKYEKFSETLADFGCEMLLISQGLKDEDEFLSKSEKLRSELIDLMNSEESFSPKFIWEFTDLYLVALDQALSERDNIEFCLKLYEELEKFLSIIEEKAK